MSVPRSVREQRVSRSVPKFKDVITGLFGSLVVEFSSRAVVQFKRLTVQRFRSFAVRQFGSLALCKLSKVTISFS